MRSLLIGYMNSVNNLQKKYKIDHKVANSKLSIGNNIKKLDFTTRVKNLKIGLPYCQFLSILCFILHLHCSLPLLCKCRIKK